MKMKIMGAALLLSALLLSSCGVQVNAVLAANKSATIAVETKISPILQAYFRDLSGSKAPFFDIVAIQKKMAGQKGISVQKIEARGSDGLSLSLKIADITQLFTGKSTELRNALSISETKGQHTLQLRISRALVKSLFAMGTADDSSSINYLMPQKDTLSTKQYQDQLNWALEEYGTAAELADMFKSSVIKVKLQVPSPIQSASGFTIVDNNAGVVAIDIKLLDLMTLSSDLVCEVRY